MKHTQLARVLRSNQTKQEHKLWSLLRNRQFFGLKFKRQYPIADYIADFICIEKSIIIELDGGQHNQIKNIDNDKVRTKYLESQGYRVIRVWNNEGDNNFEGVFLYLKEQIIES